MYYLYHQNDSERITKHDQSKSGHYAKIDNYYFIAKFPQQPHNCTNSLKKLHKKSLNNPKTKQNTKIFPIFIFSHFEEGLRSQIFCFVES